MAKLSTVNGVYIPKDVKFGSSKDGKLKKNSELTGTDQVLTNITYATLEQKSIYVKSYAQSKDDKVMTDMAFSQCLKKHVLKIENLCDDKDKEIGNGIQLVACKNHLLNEFKQDLFMKICGVSDDEDDDGSTELSEGEK